MRKRGRTRTRSGRGNAWVPPAFGACECDGHVEDVLELRIPLAEARGGARGGDDGVDGDMAVWALLTSGALATVPLAEERRELSNGRSPAQEGPFHWQVVAGDRLKPFLARGDVRLLEIAVGGQPGVERAMWMHREGALVVGAPRLCPNGVQCAVVQALRSAFVRQTAAAPGRATQPA